MEWFSLIAIAVALAMDAFAVAIVTGLTVKPLTKRHVFRLAFHFGLFQFLMPLIGWVAGSAVQKYIADFDHWIAFCLLGFVGGPDDLGLAARRRRREALHQRSDFRLGIGCAFRCDKHRCACRWIVSGDDRFRNRAARAGHRHCRRRLYRDRDGSGPADRIRMGKARRNSGRPDPVRHRR